MTIGYGTLGSAQAKASGTSLTITTTEAVPKGATVIVRYGFDNNAAGSATASAPAAGTLTCSTTGAVTGATVRATMSSGSASAAGVSLNIWTFVAGVVIPAGATITVTIAAAVVARAASAAWIGATWAATSSARATTGTGSVSATPTAATQAAVATICGEDNQAQAFGQVVGWDTGIQVGTTGGTANTNVVLISARKMIVGATTAQTYNPSGVYAGGDWTASMLLFNDTSPSVSALSPTSASNAAPVTITITGANFTDVTGVMLDSTPATSYTVNSTTQITATFPANMPGGVKSLVVTARGSWSNGDPFTVVGQVFNLVPADAFHEHHADTTTIVDAGPPPADAYLAAVLADAPLAYWRLSGDALDEVSTHHGTFTALEGWGPTTDAPGLAGGTDTARYFPRETGVAVPHAAALNLKTATGWTVEFIAKPDDPQVYAYPSFLRKGNATIDGWLFYYALPADPTVRSLVLKVPGFEDGAQLGVVPGVAHHYAVTQTTDGVLRFYRDGVLLRTLGPVTINSTTVAELTLANGDASLQGVMDEVAIYPTALSEARLLAHHQARTASPTPVVHNLVPDDALHATRADTTSLTQQHALSPVDALHIHRADATTQTQRHSFVPVDAFHEHRGDTSLLTQGHVFAPTDARHSHIADAAAMTQQHALAPRDADHAHRADAASITQAHVLVPTDVSHPHTADSVALTGTHSLSPVDARHEHRADVASLAITHNLAPVDTRHEHRADATTQTGVHLLSPDDTRHEHVADESAVDDALPSLSTLVDPFDVERTDLWDGYDQPEISVVDGQLEIVRTAAYAGMGARRSYGPGRFEVRVPNVAHEVAQMDTGIEVHIALANHTIFVESYMLYAGHTGAFVITSAYDPVRDAFWCIDVDDAGMVTYQTSPDGVTWQTIHAETEPVDVSEGLWPVFSAGFWVDPGVRSVARYGAVNVHEAAVVYDLVPDDATHPHRTTTSALSQDHALAPDDAHHEHVADETTSTGVHTLVPVDASHSHTADVTVATGTHILAPADARHEHIADTTTSGQIHNLAPRDAQHSSTADPSSLTQVHNLVPTDASHPHHAETTSMTGEGTVFPEDARHEHRATESALTQVHVLTPSDARHEHRADSAGLGQAQELQPDDARHEHTADTSSMGATHFLTPTDARHSHTADSTEATQAHALAPRDAAHPSRADASALTQVHNLEPRDARHEHRADTALASLISFFQPSDAFHAVRASAASATQVHRLSPEDAAVAHTARATSLSVEYLLSPDDARHEHHADPSAAFSGRLAMPVGRTHVVPAEIRVVHVPEDVRRLVELPEWRRVTVPVEERVLVVAGETRTERVRP